MTGLRLRNPGMRSCIAGFSILTAIAGIASPVSAGGRGLAIDVDIPVGDYRIDKSERGHELSVEGYGYLKIPGKPLLPSKIFALAVPPGAEVTGVSYETGEGIVLSGEYEVAPAPLPSVIGEEDPIVREAEEARYELNHASVYGSDDAWPASVIEFVRTAGYRKYNLADVRVTPFEYHPQSGRLIYYPDISVSVHYEMTADDPRTIADNLTATEATAREIVLNYERAQGWYEQEAASGKGLHDYVIVAHDSLAGSVEPLVAWETAKGRTVKVVTLSWINANYAGCDTAERTRNLLREKYPSDEWGIRDVLFVGDLTVTPMRHTAQDVGYGRPATDYYYAELSLPDSESWDLDGDQEWGEYEDPIDFYAEVNVGRIPWNDPDLVEAICEKSAAYEQNDDPSFKQNILLLGAYFWPDTDNAVLMEAVAELPWLSDWTMTRMYEDGQSTYAMDYDLWNPTVVTEWSGGKYAFVNWAGHGSPVSSHIYYHDAEPFIFIYDCLELNDEYPSIIFADACSNSETDTISIGQGMLYQGGVGFLGATKVAFGDHGWTDPYSGSSQSLDYFFTSCVTSGDYTQGQAQQWALREMYVNGLWNYAYYEMFEWGALFGNPDLGMSSHAAVTISFPDGVPEYIDEGVDTEITVKITDGIEPYAPDSGMMHLRMDGGPFDELPLISLGDGLYEAAIPPMECDIRPEFYFSAETEAGTTVLMPPVAPEATYSCLVGQPVLTFHDDFEQDEGWEVEDSEGLVDGTWDRGIPGGGGDRHEPAQDYDGSGQCYLTHNEDGKTDVDDGYTWLISPKIDLTYGDAEISYALWYTNDYGGAPHSDYFVTWVSNDDGATWVEAEVIGPGTSMGWVPHSFMVSDFVTPTGEVRVRFEASDLGDPSEVEAGVDAFDVVFLLCDGTCLGDISGPDGTADFLVDVHDLLLLLAQWGTAGAEGDLTGLDGEPDGVVDVHDLLGLLAVWGPCF